MFIAVAIIIVVRTLGLFVSKVIIHFGLHHFFNGAAQEIFQGILDVFRSFDIVFFEKLANDISFPILKVLIIKSSAVAEPR